MKKMDRKITRVNNSELMQYFEKRKLKAKRKEDKIRSSNEYICWLRDLLKEKQHVIDYDIQYEKNELDKTTYENIHMLSYFYSIIEEYYKKYIISPAYIEGTYKVPVYRVFYEDVCFEICKVPYLEGYIDIRKIEKKQRAINYEDIMEDKEQKNYKEKNEFMKEFQNKIREHKEKAEKLDVDVEYLKQIIKREL